MAQPIVVSLGAAMARLMPGSTGEFGESPVLEVHQPGRAVDGTFFPAQDVRIAGWTGLRALRDALNEALGEPSRRDDIELPTFARSATSKGRAESWGA